MYFRDETVISVSPQGDEVYILLMAHGVVTLRCLLYLLHGKYEGKTRIREDMDSESFSEIMNTHNPGN